MIFTGQPIIVVLVNGDKFEIVKSITSVIYTGEPGVGLKVVVVQFIGDSYFISCSSAIAIALLSSTFAYAMFLSASA